MCTSHTMTTTPEDVAPLVSRRGLLRTGAVAAAVAGASGALTTPAAATGAGRGDSRHRVPRSKISIQLFTLRDQLAADFEGTLAALAAIGYQKVEHAGFVNRSVDDFKAALDKVGIVASSGHVQIPQPFDAATWQASLQDALTLGSSHIVHPFFGINFGTGAIVRDRPTWAAFAHDLNRAGRHGPGRGSSARLPQPQLGVLPAHRRPVEDRRTTS